MSEQQQPPRRLTRKELLRRNKKIAKRRQQRLTVIVVALTAFMVYITGIYGASLAYLGDFVSWGMVYAHFGDGFPARVENQTYLQSEKMGSALCVLDSDSLDFYSPTGATVYSYYHSMQKPVISTSSKRVVIYNSNDTSLKIANAGNILFSKEMENDIIHASLSANNYLSVTTKSQSFNGEVKVYDSRMNEKFTWKAAKSFPVQSFLSPKAQTLAVSSILTRDGKIMSDIYIIDAATGEERYVYQNESGVMLAAEFVSENRLMMFFADRAVALDLSKDGVTEHAALQYYGGKELMSFDIKNSRVVMALGSYDEMYGCDIVICDLSLGQQAVINTNQHITDIEIIGQRIYSLGSDKVVQYTTEGAYVSETAVKNNVKNIVDYNGCLAVFGDSLEKIEKAPIKK